MIEGAIVLVIFLLGQLGWLVWTLSDIVTQLKNINESIKRTELSISQAYPLKDGVKLESSVEKLWEKWDFINEHMNMCPLKREKSNEQGIH